MAFFMYEMAKNPEIQQRVYDEIQEVLDRFNGELSYEALSEMKYLDSCVEGKSDIYFCIFLVTIYCSPSFAIHLLETIRKHPPFDWLTRVCTKEYKIADTDVTIEEGTLVIFSITAPLYDPEYYDDPDKFIPERFISDSEYANKKDAPNLTFGDGPRSCIGIRLGKMQTKLGVCLLLRKFAFELGEKLATEGFELDPLTVARSMIGGTKLKITVR